MPTARDMRLVPLAMMFRRRRRRRRRELAALTAPRSTLAGR